MSAAATVLSIATAVFAAPSAGPGSLEAAVARAIASAPTPPPATSNATARLRRLGASLWSDGPLPEAKVDWFCRMFARLAVTDRSLVYFAPEARVETGVVVLRGATNAPVVAEGLVEALSTVGVDQIRNEICALPDRARLGDTLFGACRAPTALTFDRPAESGAVQTQLLFGEPVYLLDRDHGFYLLHAGDGYWGWAREEAIVPMTTERFAAYIDHPRGVLLQDFSNDRLRIPRGAEVALATDAGVRRRVLLPDGSTVDVPDTAVQARHDQHRGTPSDRVRAALDLLNTPYVFGGRAPLGLDCSGLITNVWARTGAPTARDAWQQAFAGSLSATRWHRAGIRAGDQVFFIDSTGKIYHTGVAISATHVLHAAPPRVQIGSLKPGDRLYDPRLDRDFFMAKRP